ncbi:hypothetical protein [Conexibacter sp. SYSU D00693]|uniref:hypothetical protein n=1 Tax=Conexibacter sp. SYSU D00693 TaxID=2812560 RepID=UPI00196A61C4|nr:hypothetical protein [Conexibacter sp. SYSU D00693]
MRARRLTGALAAACAAAALGVAGCGDDGDAAAGAQLQWVSQPVVFAPEGREQERILSGRVLNDGDEAITVRVDQLFAEGADGRRQPANGRFAEAFGHGLYGPGGPPAPLRASKYDQRRLGEIAEIEPGQSKPLTVAWRGDATVLHVGPARLELPPAQAGDS